MYLLITIELIKAVPAIQPAIPTTYTFPHVFPKTKDYPTIVCILSVIPFFFFFELSDIPVLKDEAYDPTFDPTKCGSFEFTYSKVIFLKNESEN